MASQVRLRTNVEKSGQRSMAASYRNFVGSIYEKFCQDWGEIPDQEVYEAMYASFAHTCANMVLEDNKTVLIPSWVTDIILVEFHTLLNSFNDFCKPTSLFQLCRSVITKEGSDKLINLLKNTDDERLRKRLFVKQPINS